MRRGLRRGRLFLLLRQTLNTMYKFVPSTNTWSTLGSFPAPGAIMASAVYYPPTNKVSVFGGEDAVSGQNYNTTRIYDIATNSWSTGAPLPDVRSFAASGYNPGNQRIYVVAGYNTGQVTSAQDTVYEYNPAANTWATKTRSRTPSAARASGSPAGTCSSPADATPRTR